jgi:hypothetical protein
MPSKSRVIRHVFGGGWATDFGISADIGPDGGGTVVVPFLTEAENVFYDLDGGPRKIGGTSKLNSTVINSGNEIRGLFDFWRMGTSFAPSQQRVVYTGTLIQADAADGTFASIKTGLEDDKTPCFTTFNDVLIMSSDSTVDVPLSYDGTTVSNLGGTPPAFAFSCVHKNHVWAAGVATTPSRLYYSRLLDESDWTHATSGSIDIDPDDGDRITAIASYKNDLWVFKGPTKGSIHRITGSANTGSDSFARITFIDGLGAVSHNTLFKFRDDLGFMWSDGSVHSLKATAAYGDFNEASLSRPIQSYLNDNVNRTFLRRAWSAVDSSKSQVVFTIPIGTNQYCTQVLMMDYSREQVSWASWPALNANCVAKVIDATNSNKPILMIGGRDGYVRKTGAANKSIDGATAIAAKATLPYNNYGAGKIMKTLAGASLQTSAQGNYSVLLRWTRAGEAQQEHQFDLDGGATLDEFVLDTDVLDGGTFFERFSSLDEGGGEFRSIQFQVYNSGVDEDLVIRSIGATIDPGSDSTEE